MYEIDQIPTVNQNYPNSIRYVLMTGFIIKSFVILTSYITTRSGCVHKLSTCA